MDWKSKWLCSCGAIWTSMTEDPPDHPHEDHEIVRLADQPLLTDEWTRRLGPERRPSASL
jgi:hypothetical protein